MDALWHCMAANSEIGLKQPPELDDGFWNMSLTSSHLASFLIISLGHKLMCPQPTYDVHTNLNRAMNGLNR